MKKKFVKSTLAVAILAVAGLGGMKAYEKHDTFNGDDLLSLNIEALSQNEGYSSSQCPGPSIYADVGVSYMEYTIQSHFSDSIDVRYEEHVTSCHANGIGKKEGFDGISSIYFTTREFVKCEGEKYHILPPSL